MTEAEFSQIWTLMANLWTAAAAKKGENGKKVWQIGLAPYSKAEVTAAIMEYARKNKFFPDLADITGNLLGVGTPEADARKIENMKRMADYARERYGGDL